MQPIVILSGGLTTPPGQQSQTLSYGDTLFEYHPNDSSIYTPMLGGLVGEEYTFNHKWAWQFGLGFYQVASASIKGEVTQAPAANPSAINFWNYQYKVSSRQLLFENKLLFSLYKRYHPYLFAGLGESFNRAYGFQVTQQNSGEVVTATFEDNQNQSFIYTLGLGLDVDVLKKMRLGISYRFAYLGKYDLGEGTLDTGLGGNVFSIPPLKSMDSFNHEILIQLTYLI